MKTPYEDTKEPPTTMLGLSSIQRGLNVDAYRQFSFDYGLRVSTLNPKL